MPIQFDPDMENVAINTEKQGGCYPGVGIIGESAFKLLCRARHNNFSIWGQVNGKKLTDEHIRQLVMKGRTGLIKGFKKKDGTSTYDACLVLTDDFKVRLEFESHAKAAKTA